MSQNWPNYPPGPDFRAPDAQGSQGPEPPPATSHPQPPAYSAPPPAYNSPAHHASPPSRASTGCVIAAAVTLGVLGLILTLAVFGLVFPRGGASTGSVDPVPATSRPARPAGDPIPAAPPGPPAAGALKEQLDRQYGTFDPIRRTGTGAAVIELPPEARRGILWARTDGAGWFSVKSAREDGTGAPLFYSGEATEGSVGYALRAKDRPPVRLLVETTEAAWEIEVRPVSSAPTFTGEASGTGMAVLVVSGLAPQPVRLDYRGDANFIVVQRDAERNAHHANEIGSTTVEATLFGGVSVLEIEAWRGGQWGVRSI